MFIGGASDMSFGEVFEDIAQLASIVQIKAIENGERTVDEMNDDHGCGAGNEGIPRGDFDDVIVIDIISFSICSPYGARFIKGRGIAEMAQSQ